MSVLLGLDELAFSNVPHDDVSVSAAGSEVSALGGEGEGGDGVRVADEGVLQLHGGGLPDLDGAVPGPGGEDAFFSVGREPDGGDPVVVLVVFDGELAFSDGVPDFDVLCSVSGSDLSIVGRE